MYNPTAGCLPSSRSQFPSYSPATLGIPRPESSNSHSPSVSPLVTPNGSFDALRNLSPPLHAPPGNHYAQYMMPMQHVELLQQMWGPGPTRPTSNPSPSILMHQDTGVLQDSTAPVINTGTTAKKGGRKRKKPVEGTDDQSNTRKQSNKKRKSNSGAVAQPPNAAAVCGVGPVLNPASESVSGPAAEPADVLVPQHENANVGGSRQPRESRAVATDVWYFLWALNDKERPDKMPENQPRLMAKPDCKYVACRLCGDDEKNPRWKVWQLRDGMTSCYREHFDNQHHQLWKQICRNMSLKSRHRAHHSVSGDQRVFSAEMFHHLLMRWVAVDDQSFNVLECPEFRELLLYLGDGKINDAELPHRTKITQMVLDEYRTEYNKTKDDLKNALGRISMTTDLWSDPNRDSYMAVTSHFMMRGEKNRLEYRTCLVAFRYIGGSHSGANLGQEFLKITDELEITIKFGQITMDNASNNDTFMLELEIELDKRGLPFDHAGNRLRCFPHVVNLAVQAILKELKENPIGPVLEAPASLSPSMDRHIYANALSNDPVGQCRDIVNSCRHSGQRRRRLQAVIEEGNNNGYWKGKLPDNKDKLPVLRLLRDCSTRWSSTFKMIDRVLTLHPAIQSFLQEIQNADIAHLSMDSKDIDVLRDIHQIIEVPHAAQELLASERTPTLSMALPAYELLLTKWIELKETIFELAHYIEIGLNKLTTYIHQGRKTRIYALAMIINPSLKFEWMKVHWDENDVRKAREWTLEAMTSYRTAMRLEREKVPTPCISALQLPYSAESSMSVAARSLMAGFGRLTKINTSVRRSTTSSLSTTLATPLPQAPSPPSSFGQSIPTLTLEEQVQRDLEEDRKDAEREMQRYEEAALLDATTERTTDIVRFWEQKEHIFPLLFRIAMDVLPAQASSVPSERVFSSSKETCTDRRANLSPTVLEALQILKFTYKQDRLNFTSHLVAEEEDYTISGPVSRNAIDELMAAGKLDEIAQLLANENEA